jgi:hypothetical protein
VGTPLLRTLWNRLMSVPPKASLFSRRSFLRLAAALPFLSILGFAPRNAGSGEFVEVDGWILRRSDLRRKDRP